MTSKPNFALYGLGTMGAALALNIADNGFSLAVCNRTDTVVDVFHESAGDLATKSLRRARFPRWLRQPPHPVISS